MRFLSEGPSNYWTEGFLLKAFHGSFKMKVSTKCFVWGHSAQKSDGVFFSGSSSDSRIRRFLWKYFMKTWRHLKKPQHVVFGWYRLVFGWLRGVLGGYFSSYGCQLFSFCLTCLLFLVNLVPALTEHFLWKYNHAFSQGQLLCGYILPILWSFLMMGFCHLPGNRISFNRFRCIQKLLSIF